MTVQAVYVGKIETMLENQKEGTAISTAKGEAHIALIITPNSYLGSHTVIVQFKEQIIQTPIMSEEEAKKAYAKIVLDLKKLLT